MAAEVASGGAIQHSGKTYAEDYVLNWDGGILFRGPVDLTYQGAGVWESATINISCDAGIDPYKFTLTATNYSFELELDLQPIGPYAVNSVCCEDENQNDGVKWHFVTTHDNDPLSTITMVRKPDTFLGQHCDAGPCKVCVHPKNEFITHTTCDDNISGDWTSLDFSVNYLVEGLSFTVPAGGNDLGMAAFNTSLSELVITTLDGEYWSPDGTNVFAFNALGGTFNCEWRLCLGQGAIYRSGMPENIGNAPFDIRLATVDGTSGSEIHITYEASPRTTQFGPLLGPVQNPKLIQFDLKHYVVTGSSLGVAIPPPSTMQMRAVS